MRVDDPARPGPLPTVSFSLSPDQMEQLRRLAEQRRVSVSQIAREAFSTALAQWEAEQTPGTAGNSLPAPEPPEPTQPVRSRWPRQLRRRATRHSPHKRTAPRPIP